MGSDKTFLDQFNGYFERINAELSSTFNNLLSLTEDIGNHPFLGEGKRLRPLLFVMSSQLCGYQEEDIYHFSTIFEYVHIASLFHDKVLDNPETRRRKPSADHLWGNSAAVLSGDFLKTKHFSIAAGSNNLEFLKTLADTTTRIAEGQVLELVQRHNLHISRDEYMEVVISKIAVLFSAACACGAIMAGAEKQAVYRLSQFGLDLGIAFQIMDDLLDYTSCEDGFRKPVRKDLRKGKITLPLIYTLSNLRVTEIERLEALFKDYSGYDEDYENIVEMLRNNGVIEKVRSEARLYVDKAARFLDYFPASLVKEDLMQLNADIIRQ